MIAADIKPDSRGLVPGIHDNGHRLRPHFVDGRVKPGHDEKVDLVSDSGH
jgi:hypothetical protein